ncbi:MAG: muconate cycloisomerase family protein [Proteobacteria bacterium]|nr:muconate cycloisomerase family protein [Pseudomonadota bacterium]
MAGAIHIQQPGHETMNEIRIEAVDTVIIDLPLRRKQRFSVLGTSDQSIVIILIRSSDGAVGIGEATPPCGPWWGGESVESIKVQIDTYLAPLLVGQDAFGLDELMHCMHRTVYGNHFAKAAIEMALLDLIGKVLQQPVYNLLGGKVRESLPMSWPLATGDPDLEIAEAEEKLDQRLHRMFKLKMGALPVEEDVSRACKVARALEGRASVRVDPNAMWDESTAMRAIAQLQDAGIELIEQPLSRWDYDGASRLAQRFRTEIMLDEGLCTMQDMFRIAACRAGGTVSLKIMKSGGIRATRAIADVASASGITLYMGTFLESSYGTAANMQLCATFRDLPFGGELAGPLLLAEDICQQPAEYRDFELWLSDGVGMAAAIDEDKLNAFRRDRSYSVHVVA